MNEICTSDSSKSFSVIQPDSVYNHVQSCTDVCAHSVFVQVAKFSTLRVKVLIKSLCTYLCLCTVDK